MGIDGPMDGAAFETYVETQLAPVLNKDDVVILDNLNTHKSHRAAADLSVHGDWFLYLPNIRPT